MSTKQHSILSRLGENRKMSKDMSVQICPVTGGLPTKMSANAFETLCIHHQTRARKAKGSAFSGKKSPAFCKVCKGAIVPKDLTIINL